MDNLSPAARQRTMRSVRSRNTAPEVAVRSMVHFLGYRFRLHRADLPGTPDLVIARRRAVIFVHGCFWHQHRCKRGARLPSTRKSYWLPKLRRNKERDQQQVRELRKRGWRVLVLWECQVGRMGWLRERLTRFLAPTGTLPASPGVIRRGARP
ncbi:MAG: DNA mismatch endonuclease Vsr [Planctomycetes bacterium]|nr:DNA mismatch endonuclease Vsr [Planctomycetota bacterium]